MHLDHLDRTSIEEPRRGSNGSKSRVQGSLAQQKAKDISGETMYLTLVVVVLTGIALGVLIPLAVNYYYEEMATPPWLRDLLNEVAAPQREPGDAVPSSGPWAGESARGRSVDEEIYARSPYESPRVRRQRSSSSSRCRRAHAREGVMRRHDKLLRRRARLSPTRPRRVRRTCPPGTTLRRRPWSGCRRFLRSIR